MVFTQLPAPWERDIIAAQKRIATLEDKNTRLREALEDGLLVLDSNRETQWAKSATEVLKEE